MGRNGMLKSLLGTNLNMRVKFGLVPRYEGYGSVCIVLGPWPGVYLVKTTMV